jgi:hypothetical protein
MPKLVAFAPLDAEAADVVDQPSNNDAAHVFRLPELAACTLEAKTIAL